MSVGRTAPRAAASAAVGTASAAVGHSPYTADDDMDQEPLDWGSIHDEDGALGLLSASIHGADLESAKKEEGVERADPGRAEGGDELVLNSDLGAAAAPVAIDAGESLRDSPEQATPLVILGGIHDARPRHPEKPESLVGKGAGSELAGGSAASAPINGSESLPLELAPDRGTQCVSVGGFDEDPEGFKRSRAACCRSNCDAAAPARDGAAEEDGNHTVMQLSQNRFVASELIRPEAPDHPIRGAPRPRRSYSDAVRSRPPTARVNARRHGVRQGNRVQWKPLLLTGQERPPPGYINSFSGRCFRCLGRDHKLADCRDPLRCLTCFGVGHLARDCPEKRRRLQQQPSRPHISSRLTLPKAPVHSRLSFQTQNPPTIQSRLTFPPLPQREEHTESPRRKRWETARKDEMPTAWYPGRPENRPAMGNAVVMASGAMLDAASSLRATAVFLVAPERPPNDDINIGDISRVVAGCVRMPPSEMRTTRHHPEDYMIIFDQPHQRTLALRIGSVRVKGVLFNILPWCDDAHTRDVTWWYHVRIAIENLPRHAWKLSVLRQALGEVCLVDKIDRASFRQQASDVLYCWAWMWLPDLLPRAKTVTVFSDGAGQSELPPLGGTRPAEVAEPPRGKCCDLLIHLDIVEDWSPPRVRTPSSGQSGVPSSVSSESEEYPRVLNLDDWTLGVLDGLRARPRPAPCRPEPRAMPPRDKDGDRDDDDGPRRNRDLIARGKQTFRLLRPAMGSSSNNAADRQRTRSPPAHRRWVAKGGDGDTQDGRGRPLLREASASPRKRDAPRRGDDDWGRRRSRSPVKRAGEGYEADRGIDLGAKLLEGSLPLAAGAPPPPTRHPDPMLEFYKETCVGDIWGRNLAPLDEYDPMVDEAFVACAQAVRTPLTFSPDGVTPDDIYASPVYVPNGGADWGKLAELNEEAHALGLGSVIHFGPGSTREIDGQLITTGITEQVADMVLEERRSRIVDSMFVECEQPVLETPTVQKKKSKAAGRSKNTMTVMGGLRRSSRQQAKPCSVPVSKRATERLIRAFKIVGQDEPVGEDALKAFAKSFDTPLSDEQIAAVRRLTSLNADAALNAAAQVANAEGAEAMADAAA